MVELLRKQMNEKVLEPGEPGYVEARRVWNGVFDRQPDVIARCSDTADVIVAVDFAREHQLLLAVKSGGHDYAGNSASDGGLLIDLSPIDHLRIDPEARRANVGPGVRWGVLDRETQKHGLATTGGTVSAVGVAGYTLGGGTGHLARKHGLGLDNLVSAEVVTAAGERVRASEDEHADLFWALRGGSGNFGIVTDFEFQLHEVGPEVLGGQILFPFERAGEVLRFYRRFMQEAPDELQCYAFIIPIPPLPAFPVELHGRPALTLVVAYVGDVTMGQNVVQPLIDLKGSLLTAVEPVPYTTLQQTFDAGMMPGHRWFSKAHYLDGMPDTAIDTVLRFTESLPGLFTAVYFEPQGGAIGQVDAGATAFPHRDAAFGFHIFPGWDDPEQDDEIMSWAKTFHASMAPYATGGVYVNLLGQDERDRVRNAYGSNYERLAEVKRRWDPGNLFRKNHNIEPA